MKDKIVFKYIYMYIYIYILIDNESKHNIFFHFFFWECSKKRDEFDWVGAWSGSTIYLPIVHLYSLAEISLLFLYELCTIWNGKVPSPPVQQVSNQSPTMTKSNSHAPAPHLWAHRLLLNFLSLRSSDIMENKGFSWVWEKEKKWVGNCVVTEVLVKLHGTQDEDAT